MEQRFKEEAKSLCFMNYGQTGSGKTYTLFGDDNSLTKEIDADSGLLPRVLTYLWESYFENQKVKIAVQEIAGETQNMDLLDTNDSGLIPFSKSELRSFVFIIHSYILTFHPLLLTNSLR